MFETNPNPPVTTCPPTTGPRRHTPLLQQLDIPIQHLDYAYVKECTRIKEIEKILRILRSGEEGNYPDLEQFVENRLSSLCPGSKLLRKEIPILTHASLESSEVESINNDLLTWMSEFEKKEESSASNEILFQNTLKLGHEPTGEDVIPIRGAELVISLNETSAEKSSKKPNADGDADAADENFIKHRNPNHIKSWEYDKWSKFNVDAELTKLDIEEMREEELKQIEQKKLNSQKLTNPEELAHRESKTQVEPCPKTTATATTATTERHSQNAGPYNNSTDKKHNKYQSPNYYCKLSSSEELQPSYIEEIPDDDHTSAAAVAIDPTSAKPSKKCEEAAGKRRFKIMIEDLNIG